MNNSRSVTVKDVREWAAARGKPVGTRGRIAPALVDAFNRAHPRHKYTGTV